MQPWICFMVKTPLEVIWMSLQNMGTLQNSCSECLIQQHSRSWILISETRWSYSIQTIFMTAGMFSDSLDVCDMTILDNIHCLRHTCVKQPTQIRWPFPVNLIPLLSGLGGCHMCISAFSSHTNSRHLSATQHFLWQKLIFWKPLYKV
jgi:hypothetical protein